METIAPLLLVGVGGTAIVVTRGWQWVLSALLAQWVGLAWIAASIGDAESTRPAGWAIPAMEMTAALICVAILAVTEQSISRRTAQAPAAEESRWERQWRLAQEKAQAEATRNRQSKRPEVTRNPLDRFWLLVTVLAGAVAGYGLARIYPLGAREELLLAFYWTVLAGVLALVMDGARSHTKLAVGLLVLMNGAALLVIAASGAAPGPVTLLLLSISRVALALVLAHSWSVMKAAFDEADVSTLFNVRSGTHTALIPAVHVEGDRRAPDVEQPDTPTPSDENHHQPGGPPAGPLP